VRIDSSPPLETAGGPVQAWQQFWLAPVAPLGLHWIRVCAGLLFLAWLVPLTGEREALFSLNGWFDRQAYLEAARLPGGSPVAPGPWSLVYLCGTNANLFNALWWTSLAVLALFTLGIGTRITAVLTWLIATSFQANPALQFDADQLLAVLAFYLMIGYLFLGQWDGNLTWAERILGPNGTSVFARFRAGASEAPASSAANLALRLLQVHFALAVFVSGVHKLQFGDWWSGVAYWYPLHPPFEMDAQKLQAAKPGFMRTLFLLSLTQYIALAWQLTFPAFAFRRRWRGLLLSGAVLAWAGTVYIYRLPIFGPLFMVACLSYLTPEEWRGITNRLLGLLPARGAGRVEASIASRPRVKTST
jgi:hypothetical protein